MSKSCFVTGAGGFIGSHLTEWLVKRGWKVRALVRYTSEGRWGHLHRCPADVLDAVEIVAGDVRDCTQMDALVAGCDVVFHLAALIGIPYSYLAPRSYVEVNVTGTQNILDAAQRHGTERVVVTSTSEVYGTALYTPIDEAHRLHPQSPYAATKVAADQLALSYQRSFGTPVVIVRPFNTYGPRQSPRAVIPTIISQALQAKRDHVELGSLAPERDLLFVEDTACGFEAAATTAGIEGEVFNLATGHSVSIGELARRVLELAGRKDLPVRSSEARVRPERSEVLVLRGTAERMRDRTGWSARVDLDQGLRRTIEYFQLAEREHDLGYRV